MGAFVIEWWAPWWFPFVLGFAAYAIARFATAYLIRRATSRPATQPAPALDAGYEKDPTRDPVTGSQTAQPRNTPPGGVPA